ncbi:hypothetical protein [Nodosilinea sp. P-1105]|uniref:hypothetical protein n=1 Tax=Nodosilinea sp. P-1105 TaxID=2546229 RepID=UPI000DB86176|nr:hypothetical protein [Nodosilinea sp. P-1105]NJL47963.1 hypothetical protein [Leptolyngbyaceae cyanobacterium SM2_5_2]NMF85027.1 hypothetical protein [Nodosilinea sp. P-1105]PZU96855.1 MAG: hypothetical protein DCF32_21300 [Leptolyngbya sp.]
MTYLSDPEGVPEDWDEPILADGQQQARRKCKAMAEDYTEQGRSEVELIDVIKASTKTRNRYLCRFRSQP